MARFLVWTDLHDEFWNKIPEIPDEALGVDALLLAGDISTHGRHVDAALLLWNQLRKPVIMVRGNHEFYGSVIPELIEEEQARIAKMNAAGADIRLLDGDVTEVAGTRIIGATLWTDLDLYPGMSAPARVAVYQAMNDFSKIRITPTRHLEIEDWLAMHWKDREAVLAHLDKPFDGPTVVMTHHIPVREMVHPLREVGAPARYVSNAGFASDMGWQLREKDIDLWVCGHSHDNRSAVIEGYHGDIPFISNARGYPKEGCAFDPGRVVEVLPRLEHEPNDMIE